jgi:hypothetical protein
MNALSWDKLRYQVRLTQKRQVRLTTQDTEQTRDIELG